jgi:transposase-like protein
VCPLTEGGIRYRKTRPERPPTNGKIECFYRRFSIRYFNKGLDTLTEARLRLLAPRKLSIRGAIMNGLRNGYTESASTLFVLQYKGSAKIGGICFPPSSRREKRERKMPTSKPSVPLSAFLKKLGGPDKICRRLERCRWPDGVICPRCQSKDVLPIPISRKWNTDGGMTGCRLRRYSCRSCRRVTEKSFSFSVFTGTALQGCRIPVEKLARCWYQLLIRHDSISSLDLSRRMETTQKAAWHLLLRLGQGCAAGKNAPKLRGAVVVDVGYFDGRHKWRRARNKSPANFNGRQKGICIMMQLAGMTKGGKAVLRALPVAWKRGSTPRAIVAANIAPGSAIYTDDKKDAAWLGKKYHHCDVVYKEGKYERSVGRKFHTLDLFKPHLAEDKIIALKRDIGDGHYNMLSPALCELYLQVLSAAINQGSAKQSVWTRLNLFLAWLLRDASPLTRHVIRDFAARKKMNAAKRLARF